MSEEESAVCQLQFREEVLRKEKELLLSTSPGSAQVKEVVKSPNVLAARDRNKIISEL